MAPPLVRPDHSELTLRVLSAAVILPLAVAAIWFGGWYFGLFVLAGAGAMGFELSRLCRATPGVRALAMAALVLVGGMAFAGAYREAFACVAGAAILIAVAARVGRAVAPNLLPGGLVYIGIAVVSIFWLRVSESSGLAVFLWMVAVVVATDIGAFFFGRAIGGPKLAPRVSPAKTWSGLVGGMVCAGLAGVLAVLANGGSGFVWAALASAGLAVVAQLGDLIESAVKRYCGVKDTGNLIPGHGGVLDRLDGFLTVAPTTALMTWIAGGSPLEWQ